MPTFADRWARGATDTENGERYFSKGNQVFIIKIGRGAEFMRKKLLLASRRDGDTKDGM